MKPSPQFKKAIQEYLEKRASEDELFAVTYQKENKNLDECCNYVMQCAKKGGCQAYTNEEVFGWAVHYYDEDDIKNVQPVAGRVEVGEKQKKTKAPAKGKSLKDQVMESKKTSKKKEQPSNQIQLFE